MGNCSHQIPKEHKYSNIQPASIKTQTKEQSTKDLVYAYWHTNFYSNNNIIIPHEIVVLCIKYCITLDSFDATIKSNYFKLNGLNNNIASSTSNQGTFGSLFSNNTLKSGKHHWKLRMVTNEYDPSLLQRIQMKIGVMTEDNIHIYGKKKICDFIHKEKQNIFAVSMNRRNIIIKNNYIIGIYLDVNKKCLSYSLNGKGCAQKYFYNNSNAYRMFIHIELYNKRKKYDFDIELLSYENLNMLQQRIEKVSDIHAYMGLIDGIYPTNIDEKLKYYELALADFPNNISFINKYIIDINKCIECLIYKKTNYDKAYKFITKNMQLGLSNGINMKIIGEIGIYYCETNPQKALDMFKYLNDETLINNNWCFDVGYCYGRSLQYKNEIKYYKLYLSHNNDKDIAYNTCLRNMCLAYYELLDYKNVIKLCDKLNKDDIIKTNLAAIKPIIACSYCKT